MLSAHDSYQIWINEPISRAFYLSSRSYHADTVVTEPPKKPIPMAVDAVRAWLSGPDLAPVLAYVDDVFDRGGPEDLARLAIGLTVLSGWLTKRIEHQDGVLPHDLLNEVTQRFESRER